MGRKRTQVKDLEQKEKIEGKRQEGQDMRERRKLDKGWMFHAGEIGFVARTVAGSGKIAGITNTLPGEGKEPFAGALRAARLMREASRTEPGMEQMTDEELSWIIFGAQAPLTLEGWEEVDIPHDFRLEAGYVDDPKLYNQGHLPNGTGWYRKTFPIEKKAQEGRVVLEFDGVMRCARVWFNGCFLGEHYSGYTGFRFDVTELAKYGEEEGLNVLLVQADTTTGDEGWWYEGGGIYRHVWLTFLPTLHVGQWGVYVRPVVTKNRADIQVETTLQNDGAQAQQVCLHTTLQGPDGTVLSLEDVSVCCPGLGKEKGKQNCQMEDPVRWDVDTPALYTARVEVWQEGRLSDTYETTFGIRTVEYRADQGFFLNGRRLMLKGACVHQDFAGVGVALPDDVVQYKMDRLLDMGVNAYRSSHHPASREVLEICDRKGILLIDENRILETSPFRMDDLEEMILRGRNHPCIFAWSLSNEETFSGSAQAARIIRRYMDVVRKYDPDRLLVSAEAFVDTRTAGKYGDLFDIYGFNYPEGIQRKGLYEKIRLETPALPVMNTESVSCFTTRGIRKDDPSRGHCSNYGTPYTNRGILEGPNAGGLATPYRAMDFYRQHPESGGIFIWSGFDYRGEAKPWVARQVSCNFGAMDLCGFPKEAYYYYQSVFRAEPMVHIWLDWNYENQTEGSVELRVSTNCEEVELYLNGTSLGRKRKEGHWLAWEVRYEPGLLEAVGYREGHEVARDSRQSAGKPCRIGLASNVARICPDGESVAFVTARVLDDQGVTVPDAENAICFEVTGSGRLLGLGNGDPDCRENDKAGKRRAFGGLVLALVQGNGEEGQIQVKATSGLLQPGELTMECR